MEDFVLLSGPRGPNLEAAVEHFLNFGGFCSTLGEARPVFGGGGRQKSDISTVFCLLSGPRTPISESLVDKKETFPPVFVYFRGRADRFWSRR